MPTKVLFLAANPRDTDHLSLDEEIRAITKKIRESDYRDVLELVSALAVRPDDLLQTLNERKPHIVHFSGHGLSKGIILLGNDGESKLVSTAAIKALFTTLKDNIRVVVLNSCYSRSQAEAIVSVIDCAIGMKFPIGDQAAITFAASFYRALGFGRSVQEAFEQGNVALMLEGISEENTPDLLSRTGVNPSKIYPLNATKDTNILESTASSASPTWKVQVFHFSNWGELVKKENTGERFSDYILSSLLKLQIDAKQVNKEPVIIPVRSPATDILYDMREYINLAPFIAIVGIVENLDNNNIGAHVRVASVNTHAQMETLLNEELRFINNSTEMRDVAKLTAEKVRKVILEVASNSI